MKKPRNPLDPPGFKWRVGRPMWTASPRLRKQGWPSSIALKDEAGAYLRIGPARLMARRINEDVARHDRGVPGLEFGPGAALTPRADTERQRAAARDLNAAFARWVAHAAWRRLTPKSRTNYTNSLKRLLADWGEQEPAALDRESLLEWSDAERDRLYALLGLGWTEDQWAGARRSRTPAGTAYVPTVRQQRNEHEDEGLTNTPGLPQVNTCLRSASAFFSFIIDELKWLKPDQHPARRLRLPGLKPRLRKPTDAEAAHMIDTADAMGLMGVGDILVTMAHAGQRPADVVAFTDDMVATGRIRLTALKTRRRPGAKPVDFRPSAILARRLEDVRQRRADKLAPLIAARVNAIPPQLFLTETKLQPFTVDYLEKLFVRVREQAAKTPGFESCADLIIYDFRRLAITRLSESGSTPQRIAAITNHSLKTIDTILKHYSVATAELADQAMDALDGHLHQKGVKW